MDPDKYQAPIGLVKHLVAKKLLPDTSCKILDVGCGTGLLGKYCKEMAGYSNIDGMDNSQGMLDEAAKKGVYGKLFKGTLGEKLDCESNVYDGAVSSGVFTPGHAPASGLIEVARMVNVGGIVCYTLKLDLYEASTTPPSLAACGRRHLEDAGHSSRTPRFRATRLKDRMLCAFTWRVLK